MELELDRISYLPNEVIDKILSYLPTKDGARTSVLSSKWRYKFAMLSCLVFDKQCNSDIVNHVLLSHIGPINKFRIGQGSKDIRDIDRWILYLSRHPINELFFRFLRQRQRLKRYKMPSCMLSFQDMISLNLSNCSLKPPLTFKGFRSLKILQLWRVTLAQDVLEQMIVCGPLLERLTLEDCNGFRQFKIDAPNLQFLDFAGRLEKLYFVNTLKLADVAIDLYNLPAVRSINLLKFFDDLPKVQSLDINDFFFNYLASGALLDKLPSPCLHLKFLNISMFFNVVKHVSTAICLLRSSPALETLEITVLACKDQAGVGAVNSLLDSKHSCSFTQLRHVKLFGTSGVESALTFIRFLLMSSPVLETMTVVLGKTEPETADGNPDLVVFHNSFNLVSELLRFRRASPNLEIYLRSWTNYLSMKYGS